MKTKAIIVIMGICAIGVAIYGIAKAKTEQAKRLFEKVMFSFHQYRDAGAKLPQNKVWLLLDFALTNPTAEDFYINTNGSIQLTVIRVYLKGVPIGYASLPNFYQLDLRAGATATIENVYIEISAFSVASEIWDMIKENKKDWAKYMSLINKLSFEIDIDAFGQIYTLKQSFS